MDLQLYRNKKSNKITMHQVNNSLFSFSFCNLTKNSNQTSDCNHIELRLTRNQKRSMLLVKYFVKKQKIVDNYERTLLASFPNPAKMCSMTCVNMFLSSGQSHLFLMVNFLLFPFWTYTSDPIHLACPENFLKTHHQKFHDVMTPQIKAQPCLSSKRV